MKTWNIFNNEAPELAIIGRRMLFPNRARVGLAFLATLRKDGAPRLHPVAIVHSKEHLYVFIPPTSPKCADLQRDGRYAMQAFPPPDNKDGEEFYLSGRAECIQDREIRNAIITETETRVGEGEILFELLLDRIMYTRLVHQDTPDEHPLHKMWRATNKENSNSE